MRQTVESTQCRSRGSRGTTWSRAALLRAASGTFVAKGSLRKQSGHAAREEKSCGRIGSPDRWRSARCSAACWSATRSRPRHRLKISRGTNVTCQEYLALNPETHQRIAYWVDGYQVAPGETVILTVAFNELDEPILMLVADCQATPMICRAEAGWAL